MPALRCRISTSVYELSSTDRDKLSCRFALESLDFINSTKDNFHFNLD